MNAPRRQFLQTGSLAAAAIAFARDGFAAGADKSWRVGFAKAKITPEGPMWMSGYGPRLATEKLHDLWVKVLALEAADGSRGVLITADVCGFSRISCDAIVDAVTKTGAVDRDAILITCSHTHTGPALRECLHVCWPWHDQEARKLVEDYSLGVEAKIVDAVARAVASLEPAQVHATEGTTDFAVNRRNNREADVPAIRERGQAPRGPVDFTVPTLVVKSPQGEMRAVAFGYACHATTISSKEWSGDYPGFAMLELERLRPGVETLFFQACGADQNPIPRGTVDHCRRYGESLAKAVHRALDEPTRPLAPTFRAAYERAELNFKTPLTLEFLKAKSAEASPLGAISARHLDRVAQGEPLPTSHPYAVQAWKLGDDQLWIALSGEAVVDYSLKYKARYGERAWVAGYAHDLVCYIPSTRILKEGGGQEPGVPWDYGIPNREWADDIEDRIDAAVARLVESTLATQPRARTIPEDR